MQVETLYRFRLSQTIVLTTYDTMNVEHCKIGSALGAVNLPKKDLGRGAIRGEKAYIASI